MKPQRPQRNTLNTPEVHSSLGPVLLENLYEEAMEHELKNCAEFSVVNFDMTKKK